MSERFPKLIWLELGIDFQLGIAWFLMFTIQIHGSTMNRTSPDDGAMRAPLERLWTICQTFILISGTACLLSGSMNSRQIWKARKKSVTADRRILLAEQEFTDHSLRCKPSRSSTTQSLSVNHDAGPLEPGPSVIHWRPVSPYGIEGTCAPTDESVRGRAL